MAESDGSQSSADGRHRSDLDAERSAATWYPSVSDYVPPSGISCFNRVEYELDPTRAALLIHDMQCFWLDRLANPAPLINRIAAILAAARSAHLPIFYSIAADPDLAPRGLGSERWGPGIAAAAPASRRIVQALAPDPADHIIRKSRYSAFFETDLAARLEEQRRSQLVITGVFAHHGCLATALDGYMRDIEVFFPADGTADYGYEQHLGALRYVGEVCGFVTTAREIEQALSAPTGTG